MLDLNEEELHLIMAALSFYVSSEGQTDQGRAKLRRLSGKIRVYADIVFPTPNPGSDG